jgi:adenine/guanine phosphoribosyltransferase-like PRPP-binding protein
MDTAPAYPARQILGLDHETMAVRRDRYLNLTETYLSKVCQPEDLMFTLEKVLPEDLEYDTVVGTGLSGALAVQEVARRLGKRYLVVRKPNDGTHSWLPVFGHLGRRWLFVDDLVGSGKTFTRVYDGVNNISASYNNWETEFVGTALYNDCSFTKADDLWHHKWLTRNDSTTYDGRWRNAPGGTFDTW